MSPTQSRPDLAAMLGFLHQTRAEGELVLEQNDGTRHFYLKGGDLCYLRSDAVGEQFGNYLIRLGVLDYSALKDLLAEDGARVGDRVVQWGLLTETQRDERLRELFGSILLHAVEHPVLNMTWNEGAVGTSIGQDLQFTLDHRTLVWEVYRQMQTLESLVEKFEAEPDWKWLAREGLMEAVADLTLTPKLAFAISQLGREPMSFTTFVSVTGLEEPDAARLLAALWALGGVEMEAAERSSLAKARPNEPKAREPKIPAVEHTREHPKLPRRGNFLTPPPAPAPAPTPAPTKAPEPVADSEPVYEGVDDPLPRLDIPVPPPIELSSPHPISPEPSMEGGEDTAIAKARALYRQGEGLNTQGRTSEAIRALEQAIKLDPDSAKSYDTWMLLGELRQGNPAWSTRAVEAFQAAARAQPKKGEPWLRMGQLYHRKGFGTNATGCFRKAMELDPSLEIPDDALGVEPSAAPKEGVFGRLRGLFGGEKK